MEDSIKQKIVTKKTIQKSILNWKRDSLTTVFTNGVFDVIHRGHIDYLYKASLKADKLIIGINSDNSVKQLEKGDDRPINKQDDRAYFLAALGFVDAVLVFDEETPLGLIREIKPTVLVKGGDYNPLAQPDDKKYIVGSDFVRSYGGTVDVIPFLPGYSTTALLEKIRKTY